MHAVWGTRGTLGAQSIASGMVSGMASDTTEKVRENRLRRMAERQGLRLMKTRRRDPRAYDFGTYMLIDARTDGIVAAGAHETGYGLTLDEIERRFTS